MKKSFTDNTQQKSTLKKDDYGGLQQEAISYNFHIALSNVHHNPEHLLQ